MASLAGKSPSATYKSLLKVVDENNGVTTSTSRIEDGEGTATCVEISDDQVIIQPQDDETTATFGVRQKSGTYVLKADTQNGKLKVGTTNTNANTNILEYSAYRLIPSGAGTHMMIPCSSGNFISITGLTEISAGTGTDPNTTINQGATTDELVPHLFSVPINLSIQSGRFMVSTDQDTDCVINVHLYSFDITNAGGTSDGELTNGTLLGAGQATAVDRNVVKTVDLSLSSTSVAADKVICAFVENETNTDDINIRLQVVYNFD